jgi:hypothetical protein
MTERPQDTSAEEPDGGNPHIRFRGGPGLGNRPGLLNKQREVPAARKIAAPQIARLTPEGLNAGPRIEVECVVGTAAESPAAMKSSNACWLFLFGPSSRREGTRAPAGQLSLLKLEIPSEVDFNSW